MSPELSSPPRPPAPSLRYVDDHTELLGSQPIDRLDLGVDVRVVATIDRVAQRNPADHWFVNRTIAHHMRALVEAGVDRSERPLAGPKGRSRLAAGHDVLEQWWGASESADAAFDFAYMGRWREHVPSARALWPLQNPWADRLPFDGGAAPSDDDWRVWSHVADAVGIRSRAAILSALLVERFAGAPATRWLSIGSGATVPVARSAERLVQTGVDCTVQQWDHDPEALDLGHDQARRHGVGDRWSGRSVDLLALADRSPGEGFDLVDILGFFEYLPDEAPAGIPSASSFLETALRHAAPGGLVVLANMLDSHPQLDFVMRCVQWPYIQPRSIDGLIDVVRSAGVADDRVRVMIPDDGVYAVVAIEA